MAGKDNDSVLFRPGLLARFLLGVVFTAITGAAVWFAAENYLPADKVYSQNFVYSCSDDNVLNWQKKHFLELKYLQFKNIAHVKFPRIARGLNAEFDTVNNTLNLYIIFPDESAIAESKNEYDYAEKFSSFIELCHLAETDPSEQLFDSGSSDYKIKSWLKQSTHKLKELEQEYAGLQMKLHEYEQNILNLMFISDTDNTDLIDEADNGQEDLIKEIEQLRVQLEQLDKEQKELDFQAAKCSSSSELELIDSGKNKVFAKRQKIIADISNIEKSLSENSNPHASVMLEANESSQELVQEKEKSESIRYKMNLLKSNIAQLKDDVKFVECFLDLPAQKKENSEEAIAEAVSQEALNFYSKFRPGKPIQDIQTGTTYSFLQILAISLSLILGWFIGMTTYSKIESLCEIDIKPDIAASERFKDSLRLIDESDSSRHIESKANLGVSDNAQTFTVRKAQPVKQKVLADFEPWWVENYDRLAYQLLKRPRRKNSGIIISSLDKSKASPRFVVNLAISLSLKDQRVLLASASDDGMLEKIFTDFKSEFSDSLSSEKAMPGFSDKGFWHCLANNDDFLLNSTSTTLENLRFISAGNINSADNKDNEINNNSQNAEILSGSYFDWILVYMPDLLNGGVKAFEARVSKSPITLLLNKISDIAVIDFMTGNARRKESALKKVLAEKRCRLLEFE